MKDITIQVLKNKIESHEVKVQAARNVIERKTQEIDEWNSEISSFKHCLKILEEAE